MISLIPRKCKKDLYYINTGEIPGELSQVNLISSHMASADVFIISQMLMYSKHLKSQYISFIYT